MEITAIEPCKRNKNRVNVYADGCFLFALFLETAAQAGLCVGKEISRPALDEIAAADEKKYAMDSALTFLQYRMRSEREVADKLRRKGVGEAAAQETMVRLRELGYLNDRAFAAAYAEELSGRMGKRGIRQKLYERGIRDDAADEALEQAGGSAALLQIQAQKLFEKYGDAGSYQTRARVYRALLARGYDPDEIKNALAGPGADAEDGE